MSGMWLLLEDTRALAVIFLTMLGVFFLRSLLFPYRLGNSFLLLLCLLLLITTAVSLAADEAKDVLRLSALVLTFALLLVPILLGWNGIVILKREAPGFSSFLPLLMALVIAAGEIASLLLFFHDSFDFLAAVRRPVLLLIAASVFYASALLLAFVLYMLVLPKLPRRRSFRAVVIHGCALIHGDQVSRILAARLELALKLFRKSGGKAFLVPSGGQGSDETVSEAAVMRAYLLERGVPAGQILEEDQSHSTRENLTFSVNILQEHGVSGKIALVTSSYHVFRCVWLADRLALRCTGFGAPVAAYYWPSAVIREFVAVYSRRRYFLSALAGYLLLVAAPILYSYF